MTQVMEDYDGKVKWGYRHFPLTSIHPNAEAAANASECAAAQGKFWEFADAIFATEERFTDDLYAQIAEEVGVSDIDAFTSCVNDETHASTVSAQSSEAQRNGGTGTPFSLVVNSDGEIVSTINGAQPIANVSAILDQAL